MRQALLWGVIVFLALHAAFVGVAAASGNNSDSSHVFTASNATTNITTTTTTSATAPTNVPTTSTTTSSITTTTSTTSPPSNTTTTEPPPLPPATYPPLAEEQWTNISLKFFIIFVSVSGGVGVFSFIIVAALCCREYKLLDTDDDSETESVYSDSSTFSSASNLSDEEADYLSDTASRTERSWDMESNIDAPQAQENTSTAKRHRDGRHRSRSQSCSIPTPSTEEKDAAEVEEFWSQTL